jgi:ArsR family transcriptional regulator, arsenate/arsenite/antimonite-responsive transcriptional repressor
MFHIPIDVSIGKYLYFLTPLNNNMLSLSLRDLINVEEPEKDIQTEREEQYRRSVTGAFFEYGKLKSIPVQQKKRKIVLEEIARKFEQGRSYTEREITYFGNVSDYKDLIDSVFHDGLQIINQQS